MSGSNYEQEQKVAEITTVENVLTRIAVSTFFFSVILESTIV
jgi:hypothetical protein